MFFFFKEIDKILHHKKIENCTALFQNNIFKTISKKGLSCKKFTEHSQKEFPDA